MNGIRSSSNNTWKRFYQYLMKLNVFPGEEDEETYINNNLSKERIIAAKARLLQQQRIATRLYIIILIITLLILVIWTLLIYQTKVVTEYNPSLERYKQLEKSYPITLHCSCKTTTMSYKHFIITKVILHQICSSDFIDQKWINAFYIPDSSRYGAMDFRTTAYSQFKLLKTLCTLAHNNIFDALFQLNNTQLLTDNILSESTVYLRTKSSAERIRIDMLVRFNNALKLIQTLTHSSRIATALNTNSIIGTMSWGDGNTYIPYMGYTSWYWTVNNISTKCLCEQTTCSFPAGFYSFADNGNFYDHTLLKPQLYNASDFVSGFVGSCTPLEAIFQANFICLYNKKCLRKLIDYFPKLNEIMSTIHILNTSVSSKYSFDVNVSHLVEQLFIEQWNVSIDYHQYFNQCLPKSCTYSYTKRADIVYMITLLISLSGGLQTILRFLIPLLINYFMKKRPTNIENNIANISNENRTLKDRFINFILIIKNFLINLNLFKSSKRSPEAIYRQKLSTKFYLCFLIGSSFILLLFTTISEKTTSITYNNPSYIDYKNLYVQYSNKLICPCTKTTISYSTFINITPIYHPICLSTFITDIWLNQLILKKNIGINILDWRISSYGHFRALSILCNFSLTIIKNGLHDLNTRNLVTTQIINENLLHYQINEILEEFMQSMHTEVKRINNILRLLFQVNQYFSGLSHMEYLRIKKLTKHEDLLVELLLHTTGSTFDKSSCSCTFHSNCETPMLIMHNNKNIPVPGFVTRCSIIDSLLQSTLECLYSDRNCLKDILLYYINYTSIAIPVLPLNISQLIRTSSNSTVSILIDNLFIEQWKTSISHLNYFLNCSPIKCQYTSIQRVSYLYVITVFLSVYGGLIFSLRLLIPLIIKFILQCRYQLNQNNQTISRSTRIRIVYNDLFGKIRTRIKELNLFRKYLFEKDFDENTQIRLGRFTTKFYICLYIIGLTILALYTSIEQRTLTTKIHNLSLSTVEKLFNKYSETIECPCTKASIPIEEFVYIRPHFHQICTSIFITNEWRESLMINLNNMTYFNHLKDYRTYLSAHLRYLSGLCEYSIKHVNDTIRSFISTSFITSRLLSKISFDTQISNLLNQTKLNIPTSFTRALELVQALNNDNQFLTIYESNYKLIVHQNRMNRIILIYTKPMIYNNLTNCSCGLQSNCIQQAAFIWPDYAIVKGLLIGCLPSESLLASTLECFFDIHCINLIRYRMSGDISQSSAKPLNISNTYDSQYKINTTINELVSKLFIEKWSTNIFYDRYFVQCAPSICSYSYIDNANPLYVGTRLLGLYGGLTVVLNWLCPQIVKRIRRIRNWFHRKRRIRIVPSIT